jgi:hypothetical protein
LLLDVAVSHLRSSQELRSGLTDQRIETRHGRWWDRTALGLLNDLVGINVCTIDQKFKMQVWASGPTGRANSTNGLPFLDSLSSADMDFAQVGV